MALRAVDDYTAVVEHGQRRDQSKSSSVRSGMPRLPGTGLPPLPPPPRFDAPGHPVFAMLRTLLEERFRIAVHHETRTLPVWESEILRNPGEVAERLTSALVVQR
jgi:hypothetical protein